MSIQIQLGDIVVDIVHKDIKNLHLSVYPPLGAVRISAPINMNPDAIRVFALSKLGWIKKQRQKLCEQVREAPRECLTRESHYLWGKRYLLKVVEKDSVPSVSLNHSEIVLSVRPEATESKRRDVLNEWYREQLKQEIPALVSKWQSKIKVSVADYAIRKMKTRWGSCTPEAQIIRLNLELAKKPPECLEYIVVHEIVHLIEPTHNERFVSLMDKFLPKWRFHRDELNRLPVKHETWGY